MAPARVYEPYRELKLGIKIWPEMWSELGHYHELIWRLFMRDFSARYKQSLLGNLWNLVMPLVAIGTFMYLNRAGLFHIGPTSMPYPLYALIGLSIWQIFATGLNAGANSLVGAGDLIVKVKFPKEVLILASLAQSLYEFLIKCLLMVVFFLIFHFCPSWKTIFVPLALLPLVALTIGLSLILALLNGIMRDTANMVSLLLMFLLFLTPVLYPVDPDGHLLFRLNFLSVLINAPRDLIAGGTIYDPGWFVVSSAISLLIFACCWRMFHLAECKIPERI